MVVATRSKRVQYTQWDSLAESHGHRLADSQGLL